MPDVLVVGYGNPLSGDDGVGPAAVEYLQGQVPPPLADRVRWRTDHQLFPELADDLQQVALVIFMDASVAHRPGSVQQMRVEPHGSPQTTFHHLTPQRLLAFTRRVYGYAPPGVLLTVGGAQFDLGTTLSPEVKRALPLIAEQVWQLVREATATE